MSLMYPSQCTTCGRVAEFSYSINTADELFELLKIPGPDNRLRELYRDGKGQHWWVTYHHEGPINPIAVNELKSRETLTRVYVDTPDALWLANKSIDIKATVERRSRLGNNSLGCVWVDAKSKEIVNVSDDEKKVEAFNKSTRAFQLYNELGNQRKVAEIMGCSPQNVSWLIKQYKLNLHME